MWLGDGELGRESHDARLCPRYVETLFQTVSGIMKKNGGRLITRAQKGKFLARVLFLHLCYRGRRSLAGVRHAVELVTPPSQHTTPRDQCKTSKNNNMQSSVRYIERRLGSLI